MESQGFFRRCTVRTMFFLSILMVFLAACDKGTTQENPSPPQAVPDRDSEPQKEPDPAVQEDPGPKCELYAKKLAQCKKEVAREELKIRPEILVEQCKNTIASKESAGGLLSLSDLLKEGTEAGSCRGAVHQDCNQFVSCLVTWRRSAVCNPQRSVFIRITRQEIQVNGKTVVFVAGERIAGLAESQTDIPALMEEIRRLRGNWTQGNLREVCINSDPPVPWQVVSLVLESARKAGLNHQALVSQRLTTDKVGNLMETAALPEAWTLSDDLLAFDIPLQPEGVGTPPEPVVVEVDESGYHVMVGNRSLCPAQSRRNQPCIPLATVEGITMHNHVALRQFLYERHVRPAWQAQKVRPGDPIPPVGQVFLQVKNPGIPYHVVTETVDGLRRLPSSALKDWQMDDAPCQLGGDWLRSGEVAEMQGNCFYPVTFASSSIPAAAVVERPDPVRPDPGAVTPGMTVAAVSMAPVERPPREPAVMVEPAMQIVTPPSTGPVGASDRGLIPPGAPLDVRRFLNTKKWAVVSCFQRAGARGFAREGSVVVNMEIRNGQARVHNMGGTLAAIPSFIQCTRDVLHQQNVGTSEEVMQYAHRWTFTLQLRGQASE